MPDISHIAIRLKVLSECDDSPETYQRLLCDWFPRQDIKELVFHLTRLEKERRILLDASEIYMAECNRLKNKVEDLTQDIQDKLRHIKKLEGDVASTKRKRKERR